MKPNIKMLLLVSCLSIVVAYCGYAMFRTIPFYRYIAQGNDRHHGWRSLLHISDDELGFAPQPGAIGAESARHGPDVPVRYDSFGFRVPLHSIQRSIPFKRPLILTLGDSFTFGAYCLEEDTFAERLADRLGGTTLNAGFSSSGLARMEILAQRLIAKHKPDWVVVQFSPWLAERAMRFLGSSTGVLPSPYYFIDESKNVQIQRPLFRWYNWYKILRDEGYLSDDPHAPKIGFVHFFIKVGFPYFLYADYQLAKGLLGMKFGLIPKPMTDVTSLNTAAYKSIFSHASNQAARMVIVRLSRYGDDKEEWDNLKRSFEGSSLLFVDAEQELIDNLPSKNKDEYLKQYAFWYGDPPEMVDSHPNPKAHRIIADALAKVMLDRAF